MIIVMIEAGYRGHSPINSHIIPIISYLVYLHYNSIYIYIYSFFYLCGRGRGGLPGARAACAAAALARR